MDPTNESLKRVRLEGGGPTADQKNIDLPILPSKVPCQLNQYTTTQINAYRLEVPKPGEPGYIPQIYKYRVDIFSIYKNRPKADEQGPEEREKNITEKSAKFDVPLALNRNICFNVIEQVAQKEWKWKGKEYAYDRSQILYSSEKLCEPNATKIDRIEIKSNDRLKALDKSWIGNPIAFRVQIQYVENFELSPLNAPLETAQFLEIVTSMKAYRDISEKSVGKPGRQLSCFRNDFYFPERSNPFQNDPRILMHGVNKSVKLIGDNAFKPDFMLQLDSKSSPFFPAGPVINFLKQLFDRKNSSGFGGGFGGGRGGFGRDNSRGRGRGYSSGGSSRGSSYDSDRRSVDRFGGRDDRYGGDRGRRDDRYDDRSRDRYDDRDSRDSRSGGNDDASALANILSKNQKDHQCALFHMKNVIVRTTHLGERNKSFAVHDLSDIPIGELSFQNKQGEKIYCGDHFEKTYKLRVNRDLPAIVHSEKFKGEMKKSFYPMEVLQIEPGQRVNMQKSQFEPSLGEIMTRQCQQLPAVMKKALTNAKEELYLTSSNIYLKHFGIRIHNEFAETRKALDLPPPQIYYSENRCADLTRDVSWRLNGLRVRDGNHDKVKWCVVDVHNQLGQDLYRFVEQFERSCRTLGVNLPRDEKPPRFESRNPNYPTINDFELFFADLKAQNFDFVMFFSKSKTDDIHHMIKYGETLNFGICTQHVTYQSARQAKTDTLNNIILKTNLKLGGSNQLPKPVRELEHHMTKFAIPKETLFIGVSFSGAGPMGFDTGDNSPPGAAAIAFTTDAELRVEGNYWFYENNKTGANAVPVAGGDDVSRDEQMIQGLCDNYKRAIRGFIARAKVPPRQCYIYRAGTSDGELTKVQRIDTSAFERAMTELQVKFPYVCAVAISKSLNRLFKPQINEQDRAPQQNVRAGACVINELTHPMRTEFIMQSHKSIQGTGRPVRYVVVADTFTPRLSVDTLTTVTHTLSFNHQIVASPVSICSVLYAAKELAERGQKMLKVAPKNKQQTVADCNANLVNKLSHRFWA